MKTSVRIGAFEIDDGELHGESPGDPNVNHSL
ncbi:protein [Escherichia coli]|nr:protein [Escherichia coli]